MPACNIPLGSHGLRVDSQGKLFEPPASFWDFDRVGTTPGILLAEAWKLSSQHWKATLLSLLSMGSSDQRIGMLLETVTASWVHAYGGTCYSEAAEDGIVAVAGGDIGTNNAMAWPTLKRESFDVIVSSFQLFRQEPESFGWCHDSCHQRAVDHLATALRTAFQAEIDGPWREGQDNGWLNEPTTAVMAQDEFDAVVNECLTALKVRRLRNNNGAHPFKSPDPEVRQEMLRLYIAASTSRHPVFQGMERLAQAAIPHVTEVVNKASKPLKGTCAKPLARVIF